MRREARGLRKEGEGCEPPPGGSAAPGSGRAGAARLGPRLKVCSLDTVNPGAILCREERQLFHSGLLRRPVTAGSGRKGGPILAVTLHVEDLHVEIDGTEILKGVSLEVKGGELHALMGPNGSGKTTLAFALMGHPSYEITGGRVLFNGEDLLAMSPDERARAGLFLSFQYPSEVSGVTVANFIKTAMNSVRGPGKEISLLDFQKKMLSRLELLEMDESYAGRYLNEGFSGGEKKRNEILQLTMLEPKLAILDETDSGLDIDALKVVSRGVNALRGPEFGALVITHYQRILHYLKPDFVHVLMGGRIVRSGGPELAEELEAKGYEWLRQEVGA